MQPTSTYSLADYRSACDAIHAASSHKPTVGLILGSGLGPLAESIDEAVCIPYADIPNFPQSSAPGHAGQLVTGKLCGQVVMAMQGRVHTYEGYTPAQVAFPVRVMKLAGVERLIVTNAAGGLNSGYKNGDLMLIEDHVNLAGGAGMDPMRGPNLDALGPRFTGMTQPYDTRLMALATQAAAELNVSLYPGILAFWAGPTFETPAEARMLRTLGADAVCMSTVPEVMAANHCGIRVLGISAITNMVVDVLGSGRQTTEEEIFANVERIVPYFRKLIERILSAIR